MISASSFKFATSIWSREAKKQGIMALYQLSVMNPIVGAGSSTALWGLLSKVWEAFGENDFKTVCGRPPQQDRADA